MKSRVASLKHTEHKHFYLNQHALGIKQRVVCTNFYNALPNCQMQTSIVTLKILTYSNYRSRKFSHWSSNHFVILIVILYFASYKNVLIGIKCVLT